MRDLDGGEPEVLVDLYTGGAHCCSFTLILRWDAAAQRYRSTLGYWGNYGTRLVDLDHDGLPEFSAFDERFVYEYTAYVFSSAPIRDLRATGRASSWTSRGGSRRRSRRARRPTRRTT